MTSTPLLAFFLNPKKFAASLRVSSLGLLVCESVSDVIPVTSGELAPLPLGLLQPLFELIERSFGRSVVVVVFSGLPVCGEERALFVATSAACWVVSAVFGVLVVVQAVFVVVVVVVVVLPSAGIIGAKVLLSPPSSTR